MGVLSQSVADARVSVGTPAVPSEPALAFIAD